MSVLVPVYNAQKASDAELELDEERKNTAVAGGGILTSAHALGDKDGRRR